MRTTISKMKTKTMGTTKKPSPLLKTRIGIHSTTGIGTSTTVMPRRAAPRPTASVLIASLKVAPDGAERGGVDQNGAVPVAAAQDAAVPVAATDRRASPSASPLRKTDRLPPATAVAANEPINLAPNALSGRRLR